MATDSSGSDAFMTEAGRQGRGDAQAGIDKRDSKAVMESIAMQAGPVPRASEKALYAEYGRVFDQIMRREDLVDAGSEMSFPASDPPSYMAGASVAGAPPPADAPREKPGVKVSDPAEVKPSKEDITNPPPGGSAERATQGKG